MNIYRHRNVLALLLKAAARKALKEDSNPDLCDAGAGLSQLKNLTQPMCIASVYYCYYPGFCFNVFQIWA